MFIKIYINFVKERIQMYFKTNCKIISFITMIAMVLTLVTPVFAAQVSDFTDFPTGWSKDAMTSAVENGILNGRTSTTINPKDNLTRAEMATIINRVFGATVKADISHLTDVSRSDWYYDEIAKAVNMRTFQGDSATTMNPDSYITREQVFVAIARALVLSTTDFSALDKYPDSADVSDWAKSSASVLVSKGYVNGYGDTGTFSPKSNITREEFAQVMYNIIKTYYISPGIHNQTGLDSTLVRTTGVTVKDVTIDGDLIIGDGVGAGNVIIENVTVKGRLLCRGGEGSIRLINTKVNGGVVVNDVNGTVHFDNYRSESVFNNIILNTPATFKKAPVGGGGSSGGGNSGGVETYYTVSFHNGATASVFDTVNINQSIPAESRTLSYVGKNLDTIYAGKLDTTGQTYNRSDIPYTGLGATYTHTVGKEFIYKNSNGIWDVFTNNTSITGNIDVYYGQKHIMAEIDKQIFGINPVLEISYDSTSRFFDTLKDGMISAGLTLNQSDVKNKINSKIQAVFDKVNAETGMVDSQGNILDNDYCLKIIDMYKNYSEKFVDTIKNNDIYKYNENASLKKLVEETDWFSVLVGYDPQRVNDATGVTGYYFKEFMDYYTSMLDVFILCDQALCFYNTENCTDEELILVKKSLTKDFVTFIKKLEELPDNIENGRPIVGSYTLSDLIAKVDSFKTVVDSLGGTSVGGYEDAIKSVIDNVKQILTNLGEGDLPNGYTFDDLDALCDRLNDVINGMNTGDYDSANASFEILINKSISKLAAIIDELDSDGTIAGRPLDAIFSKIPIINEIYSQYEDEFKDIISAIADIDIDSIDISVSLEKFEDIIFGREENIFNADTVVNIIGSKFTPSAKSVLDTTNGKYIIDKYSKSIIDHTASLERNFY